MASPDEKYDVFIVHSTDDGEKAMKIDEALRKRGYNTCAHYKERNFDYGKPVFDNIISCVERSDMILILLTENAIASQWVTFEILMSLEKAHRKKEMGLRLVMEGVSKEQRDKFKTGELQFLPDILLDFSDDKWADELDNRLKETVTMADILPTGNVSHGLVFNYFIGYLRLLLPEFKKTLGASEICRSNPGTTYPRFILLLPNSCTLPKMETQGPVTVKQEGCLSVEVGRGDKKRVFNPVLYSIQKNDKKYYFAAECPNILTTIAKLADLAFRGAGVDVRMQTEKFRILLDEIVNHRENIVCNDSVTLISYDDADTSPASVIWDKLQTEEMPFPSILHSSESADRDDGETSKIKSMVGITEDKPSPNATVCTVTNYDAPKDNAVADEVMTFLADNDVTFSNGDGQTELSRMQKARWNIFVLSPDAIADHKMARQYESAIAKCLNDNQVQVIPILVEGTAISEIPRRMKWITVLEKRDGEYLHKLRDTMQGGDVKMVERIQAGDVSFGLAWTYLLNYLPVALLGMTADKRGFRQRFEDAVVKYKPDCPCIARLFLIIPKSCEFPAPGELNPGEEYLGPIEPVVDGYRKYLLHLYRITLPNGDRYCYTREYTPPTVSLYEMAHKYPFAGIHVEEMHSQAAMFADHLQRIVGNRYFKAKVGDLEDRLWLVQFDDAKETTTEALTREITRCVAEEELI